MTTNTEAVRAAYAAFAAGDIPTALAMFSPQIRWTEAAGGPYGGVFIGPEAVVANVFMPLVTAWDFKVEPHEHFADGNVVVSLGTYRGTFKATGKSFESPFAHVWRFEGGKVVMFDQYVDTALHRMPMQ